MNEGYKKVADIVFGIRIDESTHQVIDGCDISDNKNLYFHKYKIIGTKSFLFEDRSLVDTKLVDYNRQIKLLVDKVPNLRGTWFVAISKAKDSLVDCRYKLEFIRKRANSETSYLTGFDSNISLPVYKKDGTLLTLVHEDTGCYEISTDYGITMNYKTLEYDWYNIHENNSNSVVLGTENYFSSLTSLSSRIHHPILYEKVEDNIKKFMNSYIIGSNYTGSLILPADCKYAHIMDIRGIKELVLNKELQYIEVDASNYKSVQITIYISKYVTKYLMGCLLGSIACIEKRREPKDVEEFRKRLANLVNLQKYEDIWDLCNIPENKSILQHILSGIEVVVY
jgi:hypothetical protein